MRKLAKKLGFNWFIIAVVPLATLTNFILKPVGIDTFIIVSIQLPLLAIQLFGLFMIIRYPKDVFK